MRSNHRTRPGRAGRSSARALAARETGRNRRSSEGVSSGRTRKGRLGHPFTFSSALAGFLEVHSLAQFLAGFEVRDVLLRHLHSLARLGIASRTRRPVVESEAAEAANLDAFSLGQALRHGVENHLDRKLGIFGHQLRELRRQAVDQLRFGHHGLAYPWFLLSSLALSSAPRLVVPALAL